MRHPPGVGKQKPPPLRMVAQGRSTPIRASPGARSARERGWFKPRGSVAVAEAQASVAALLQHR